MYRIVNEFPNDFIFQKGKKPYISLYQPTHRFRPEKQQDLIRYRNLVREVEESLRIKYPQKEIKAIMDPFYELMDDIVFWEKTYDGIGILSYEGQMIIYDFKRPVEEIAVVSDSFHIKPLIRNFQSSDIYHLLGINKQEFSLFEGNRYGLYEVDLSNVDTNIKDVLGDEYTSPHVNMGGGSGILHGHGGRKDEVEVDTEKFFRHIDRVIYDNYSNESKYPLILMGLDENQGIFRKISKNPYLIPEGIKLNYDSKSLEDLTEGMWTKVEPHYLEKTEYLVKRFKEAESKDLGTADINQVARALFDNRIDSLIIEADRIIPGYLDEESKSLKYGELINPSLDDVLDDLAEGVLERGGSVIVIAQSRMPTDTGVAAIYRY